MTGGTAENGREYRRPTAESTMDSERVMLLLNLAVATGSEDVVSPRQYPGINKESDVVVA
jgi:hypothetical protein